MKNKQKIVVTSGYKGADADVFACVPAYTELLRLQGFDAIPVITGDFTSSVTPSLLNSGAKYEKSYLPDGTEKFVLVDISEAEYFAKFVDLERVSEVYDHRRGYEDYWKEKIGSGAHIELVGACGTLIWEEFKKRNQAGRISQTSARLLLASIVSNTINFQASVTTERDRQAFQELQAIANLPADWAKEYFLEQEEIFLANFKTYIESDIKVFKSAGRDFVIAQIELWDAEKAVSRTEEIAEIMGKYGATPWIVIIHDIARGFDYIFSRSEEGKAAVSAKFGFLFTGDFARTEKPVMRKELVAALRGE